MPGIPSWIKTVHIFADMYGWTEDYLLNHICVIKLEWLIDNRNYLMNQGGGHYAGFNEAQFYRASLRVQNRLKD
jgi:hypothetical protein